MKSYNGFSGELRNKAQQWLNRMWNIGTLGRPKKCCACGQDQGIIDAHAEDYSEPFAAGKTDEFHLCFRCHMVVHCRFHNPTAWQRYKIAIARGGRFPAARSRDFGIIASDHLANRGTPYQRFEPPARLVLEEIEEYVKTHALQQ